MAKKKKRYPNRKRNIIRGSLITAAAVLLIAAGIALAVFIDVQSKSYVATINGEKISVGDYKMSLFQLQIEFEYYYGTDIWSNASYVDYAKQQAYSYVISDKVALMKAKELSLDTLSEEQEADVTADLEFIKMYYGADVLKYMGLSDDELFASLSVSYINQNLYDKITEEGYVFDEVAFEAEYETYLESNTNELKTYDLYLITVETFEEMNEVAAKLNAGADFRDLVVEHSLTYSEPEPESTDETENPEAENPETEAPEDENTDAEDPSAETPEETDYALATYEGSNLPADIKDAVFALKPGQVSDVIQISNEDSGAEEFVMLKLLDVREPDYEKLKNDYKDNYVKTGKDNYFNGELSAWAEEYDIVENEKALSAVKMYEY